MASPRDLGEMREIQGRDDESVVHLSDEGGIWLDSLDANRVLLHGGLPALDAMGGKPNLDAIGDMCPKDDVDLIVVEGGEVSDPLEYGYCEVCGGMWLDLGLEEEADIDAVEEGILDFFRDFRRTPGVGRP